MKWQGLSNPIIVEAPEGIFISEYMGDTFDDTFDDSFG
jgi:hypothetical protein